MWNGRYGPALSLPNGMHGRGGRMMGGTSESNTITPEEALEIAQRWLDTYRPGVTVEEHADPFYGYYTIHTLKDEDGQIEGMLSVHGTTGQVWYHTWHGEFIQMLYNDYPPPAPRQPGGERGWMLVCGSGFEEADLDELPGDILIVGPCAYEEVGDLLAQRYPDRRIYRVEAHNDLMTNTRYQARLMGGTPVMMVPLNPLVSAFTLLQAKLHGLTARVPPLLG